MADLATLAGVRAVLELKPEVTAHDGWLNAALAAASGFVRSYTNLALAVPAASFTDVRDGHGGTMLPVAELPLVAVTSVVVDGQPIPQRLTQPGEGWAASPARGLVVLDGYVFSRGVANVEITYTAGYATVPAELERACIDLVVWVWKARDRIGHLSKGVGPEQISFKVQDLPDLTRTYLDQLRKVAPS